MTAHPPTGADDGRVDADPPDPLPPEVHRALDRAIASVPDVPMPSHMYGDPPPKSPRVGRTRTLRAGLVIAAAAAVVLVILLRSPAPGPTTTDGDTAAPPPGTPATSDSTTPSEVAGGPEVTIGPDPTADAIEAAVRAQVALDAETAAANGLTLGFEVVRADGSVVVDDQPQLVAVVYDNALLGYAEPGEFLAGDSYTVYGPDGREIVGVMDREGHLVPAD